MYCELSGRDTVTLISEYRDEFSGEVTEERETVALPTLTKFFNKCISLVEKYSLPERERVLMSMTTMKSAKFPYSEVREGQAEFAEVLLDAGANPLLNEAEMVFELCMHGPALLLQRVIEQHQVPLGMLGGSDYMGMVDYAAAEGQIDCLKVLHAAGADMLAHNGRALCMACRHRQPEAVRYLVHECHAPLEQEHDDRSPLLYAVQADAPECARILLDAGANPHHPDMEGTALLQWAKSDAMRQLLATYCPR
jgi:ankyrin repeat protein